MYSEQWECTKALARFADAIGVSADDIKAKRREAWRVKLRDDFVREAVRAGFADEAIGKALGRDRTTIVLAKKRITNSPARAEGDE